jgi:hypothetical protein
MRNPGIGGSGISLAAARSSPYEEETKMKVKTNTKAGGIPLCPPGAPCVPPRDVGEIS